MQRMTTPGPQQGATAVPPRSSHLKPRVICISPATTSRVATMDRPQIIATSPKVDLPSDKKFYIVVPKGQVSALKPPVISSNPIPHPKAKPLGANAPQNQIPKVLKVTNLKIHKAANSRKIELTRQATSSAGLEEAKQKPKRAAEKKSPLPKDTTPMVSLPTALVKPPTETCRFCNGDLKANGGMKIKKFGFHRLSRWIAQNIGYTLSPVANNSDFPDSICGKCINIFAQWINCFGEESNSLWDTADFEPWAHAWSVKAAATQTETTNQEVENLCYIPQPADSDVHEPINTDLSALAEDQQRRCENPEVESEEEDENSCYSPLPPDSDTTEADNTDLSVLEGQQNGCEISEVAPAQEAETAYYAPHPANADMTEPVNVNLPHLTEDLQSGCENSWAVMAQEAENSCYTSLPADSVATEPDNGDLQGIAEDQQNWCENPGVEPEQEAEDSCDAPLPADSNITEPINIDLSVLDKDQQSSCENSEVVPAQEAENSCYSPQPADSDITGTVNIDLSVLDEDQQNECENSEVVPTQEAEIYYASHPADTGITEPDNVEPPGSAEDQQDECDDSQVVMLENDPLFVDSESDAFSINDRLSKSSEEVCEKLAESPQPSDEANSGVFEFERKDLQEFSPHVVANEEVAASAEQPRKPDKRPFRKFKLVSLKGSNVNVLFGSGVPGSIKTLGGFQLLPLGAKKRSKSQKDAEDAPAAKHIKEETENVASPISVDEAEKTPSEAPPLEGLEFHCEHCKIHHELSEKATMHQCKICCRNFMTERERYNHLTMYHPGKFFKCLDAPRCKFFCFEETEMNEHICQCSKVEEKLLRRKKNIPQPVEKAEIPHCNNCELHQKLSSKGKLYKCDICCELLFSNNTPKAYVQHLQENHPDKILRCWGVPGARCNVISGSEFELKKHLLRCSNQRIARRFTACSICFMKFKSFEEVADHYIECQKQLKVLPSKHFRCVKCGFDCLTEEGIKRHQVDMHGEPSFCWAVCSQCSEECLKDNFDAHECEIN